MNPRYRTHLRAALPIGFAVSVIGVSFGSLAVSAGVPADVAVVMSLLTFAGGSQFAFVGVVGQGGSAIAAVVAGLLLNARYLPFGAAIGQRFGRGTSTSTRVVAAHLVIDESAALALAQRDGGEARIAFWTTGLVVFVGWNAGTIVGVFAGGALGDPRALGLDAALPASLLAMLAPQIRSRRARASAVAGALLAVALVPFVPAGVPVIGATAAAFVGLAFSDDLPRAARVGADR